MSNPNVKAIPDGMHTITPHRVCAGAAAATIKMPAADTFWGDRYGVIEDPFGHSWSVAKHIRDVTPEEMQQAMKQMCA